MNGAGVAGDSDARAINVPAEADATPAPAAGGRVLAICLSRHAPGAGLTTRDIRIDAYIKHAAEFARPILTHLRALVHEACPDVGETIKWGVPHFDHHGIMCMMAAFKAHAVFGFWKGTLIVDAGDARSREAMGQFGRIRALQDLPPDRAIKGWIKRAAALNEAGVKVVRPPKHAKPATSATPGTRAGARTPADLAAGLRKRAKARQHWDAFAPGQRREYIEWITGAKRPETRAKRLATTLEWLAEGKRLHWKYQ